MEEVGTGSQGYLIVFVRETPQVLLILPLTDRHWAKSSAVDETPLGKKFAIEGGKAGKLWAWKTI